MTAWPAFDPLWVAVAAGIIALLLLRAALHKVTDFQAFTGTVADYQILPEVLVGPVARFLPGLEVALAVGLVWTSIRPIAALLAAMLLIVYAVAMSVPLSQGRTEISCGCGGPADHLSLALLLRNGILSLICMVAASPIAPREINWLDFASIPAAVLVLWLVIEAAEQALQNQAYIASINSRFKGGS